LSVYFLKKKKFRNSIPGRGEDFFLFATAFRLVLGPTQPPTKWILKGGYFPGGKVAGA